MSQKPKFDPSRVASLLSRGAEEGGGPLSERSAAPVLSSVPPASPPPSTMGDEPAAVTVVGAEAAEAVAKRPITVRLTEEVLHALLRRQADMRCQAGARLGDTTIGGVMDTLLRGPLGLA